MRSLVYSLVFLLLAWAVFGAWASGHLDEILNLMKERRDALVRWLKERS